MVLFIKKGTLKKIPVRKRTDKQSENIPITGNWTLWCDLFIRGGSRWLIKASVNKSCKHSVYPVEYEMQFYMGLYNLIALV